MSEEDNMSEYCPKCIKNAYPETLFGRCDNYDCFNYKTGIAFQEARIEPSGFGEDTLEPSHGERKDTFPYHHSGSMMDMFYLL